MTQIFLKKKPFAIQSLTNVYGIGSITGRKVLSISMLHPNSTFASLRTRFDLINSSFNVMTLGFSIRRQKFVRILSNYKNATYSGIRTIFGLPVRGQRTHTNAKTVKNLHSKGTYFGFSMRNSRPIKSIKTSKKKDKINKLKKTISNNKNAKKK